jgi:hypothetical protein
VSLTAASGIEIRPAGSLLRRAKGRLVKSADAWSAKKAATRAGGHPQHAPKLRRMGFAPPVLANGESVLGAAPARVTGAGVDKMIDHVQAFCDVFLGVYNANSTGAVKAQVLPTQLGTATAVCTTPVVCVAPPLFPLHVGQVAAFVVAPSPSSRSCCLRRRGAAFCIPWALNLACVRAMCSWLGTGTWVGWKRPGSACG